MRIAKEQRGIGLVGEQGDVELTAQQLGDVVAVAPVARIVRTPAGPIQAGELLELVVHQGTHRQQEDGPLPGLGVLSAASSPIMVLPELVGP